MKTPSPLYRGAVAARRRQMQYARECVESYRRTLDPVYLDMARVHIKTARTFNRHAWKGS